MTFDDNYWIEQRAVGDELADTTIAQLFALGEFESVRQTMSQFIGSGKNPPTEFPPALQEYREKTRHLPTWFDSERIARAQTLADKYGLEGAVILLCKSLPQCYSLAKGADVLHTTSRLINRPEQATAPFVYRIMETLQFLMNVVTPNCFDDNADGIATVRRVRLIHATIRHFLTTKGNWDSTSQGTPINQEDLVLTLTTFSVSIIEGWEKLGIRLTHIDREDFTHLWAVIGYILGIHKENIPHTYSESKEIQRLILKQQGGYTVAGHELTMSVTKFVELISRSIIHRKVTVALMCLFLSPETRTCLGLPRTTRHLGIVGTLFKGILEAVVWVQQKSPLFSQIIRGFTGYIVKKIINHYAGTNPIRFVPPDSLRG